MSDINIARNNAFSHLGKTAKSETATEILNNQVYPHSYAGLSQLEKAEMLADVDKGQPLNNFITVWDSLEKVVYKDTTGNFWKISNLMKNAIFDKDTEYESLLPTAYLIQPCRLATSLVLFNGHTFNSDSLNTIHKVTLQKEHVDSKGEIKPHIEVTLTALEFIKGLIWRGMVSPIVVINNFTYRVNTTNIITFSEREPLPTTYIQPNAESPSKLKSSFIKGSKNDRFSYGKTETDQKVSRYFQNIEVRLNLNDYRGNNTIAFIEYRFLDGTKARNLWFTLGRIDLQKSKKSGKTFLAFNDAKDKPYNALAMAIASGTESPWYNHLLIALTELIGQSKIGALTPDKESQWLNPEWQKKVLRCDLEQLPSSYITIKNDKRCTRKKVKNIELLDSEINIGLTIDIVGTKLFHPNKKEKDVIRGFTLKGEGKEIIISHPEGYEKRLNLREYISLAEKATLHLERESQKDFNSVQTLDNNKTANILAYRKALPKPTK